MVKDVIDDVGRWTEIKLQILREYSAAYTKIMKNQKFNEVAYIDGFAGPGQHISRETKELIEGSPSIALNLPDKFTKYHFIDLDGKRTIYLRNLSVGRPNVTIWEGDCNEILLKDIFPHYPYKSYRRALCLLDPNNLNPKWEVVKKAGDLGTIEIFLNFMVMDANQNVLFADPEKVEPAQKVRMNDFWGDCSWETISYDKEPPDLFGIRQLNKVQTEVIIGAYRERLRCVAGFNYVPEPIPMKNSRGATIYYLFFASQNATGNRIAQSIFKKYRML